MKKTDLSAYRRALIVGGVAVILSGAGGWVTGTSAGRKDARVNALPLDHGDLTDSPAPGSQEMRKPSGGDPAEATGKIHVRLWKVWNESPDPNIDPAARAKIARLVATMSSSQIEAFLRSLPPGSEKGPYWQLRRLILFQWVRQDGLAAMAYMSKSENAKSRSSRMDTSQLAMLWAGDQPDMALAWMNDESLPPELKKRAANFRFNSLMVLMETNPDRAFQELSRMSPADVSRQLKNWAGTQADNPKVRQRVLEHAAATGDPKDLTEVRSILVSVLSAKDPAAAAELMDSLPRDSAEFHALELVATVGRAGKEPKATYDEWLEKTDVSAGIPETISYGIGSWMGNHPDEAIKWLDGQPLGEKRDVLYADSIPALAGFDHFDKAAQIATSIGSPDLRANALHALDLRWSLVNQEAAEKWRKSLSTEDRELLGK
jgi:hypothetical protein